MKATGIVRRVDDLGRIVIPKEIRRTLGIREGEAMEIYTDSDGSVIYRKYSHSLKADVERIINNLSDTIEDYREEQEVRNALCKVAQILGRWEQ